MDDSVFSLEIGYLFKVAGKKITLAAYGHFSMDSIWKIIRKMAVDEIGLVVTEAIFTESPDLILKSSVILITCEGAYFIQEEGQLYEEVFDGYSFGFINRPKAGEMVRATFNGEVDPSYLKYSADDSYPTPPCYT